MDIRSIYRRILSKEDPPEGYEYQIRFWFPFAMVVGLVVGSVMAGFHIFIVSYGLLFPSFHPLAIAAIGGIAIIGLVILKIERPDQNGISYVIRQKHQGEEVPFEVGKKKLLSSGIGLGSGLPMGREGPALIIGSALTSLLSKWMNVSPDLRTRAITLGAAASTGALFQAPFGSAVFAAEVPYKEDSDEPMMMGAFLSSVSAAVTAKTLIAIYSSFFYPVPFSVFVVPEIPSLPVNIPTAVLALVFGGAVGIIGRFFIWFYYRYSDGMQKFPVLIRMTLGLLLSLLTLGIGVFIFQDSFFIPHLSFYSQITFFITNASPRLMWTMVSLLFLQMIATTAVIGVGFPGGIFGPSLTVGGLAGIIFGLLVAPHSVSLIAAWAIVGMSASHTATTKTPIASVLLILEITGLPLLVIPIVLANLSSYAFSGSDSLYRGQLTTRTMKIMAELSKFDHKEFFKIEEVMTPRGKVVYVSIDQTIGDVLPKLRKSGKRDFPILQGDRVVGMLHLENLDHASPNDPIKKYMEKPTFVSPQMSGKAAIYHMLEADVERSPVVDDEGHLQGIVSIRDIVRGVERNI
ncbi:MAG: chloride channel protein [Methanobacteriota archaeon]|nr:MAG: chloride channel protein [Euryarchaeota archaeon]